MAILYLARLVPQRQWGALVQSAVVGGGVAAVGALLTRLLGYTDRHAGLMLAVGPNPVAFRRWPWALFLSFGPLLFLGFAGLARLGWSRRDGAACAASTTIALAFYFLIDDGAKLVTRRKRHLLVDVVGLVLVVVVHRANISEPAGPSSYYNGRPRKGLTCYS